MSKQLITTSRCLRMRILRTVIDHLFPSPVTLLISALFLSCCVFSQSATYVPDSVPLSCSVSDRNCSAYLYYMLPSNESVADVQSLFNVELNDITVDSINKAPSGESLFIRLNCFCLSSLYSANTTYTKTTGSAVPLIWVLNENYEGLAWSKNDSVLVTPGSEIPVSLLCGCPNDTWDYLLSYVAQSSDTLAILTDRFNSSMEAISFMNSITNTDLIYTGKVYYIPIHSGVLAPGRAVSSTSVVHSPMTSAVGSSNDHHRISVGVILAIVGGAFVLVLIFAVVVICIQKRSSLDSTGEHGKVESSKNFNSSRVFGRSCSFLLRGCVKSDTTANDEGKRVVKLSSANKGEKRAVTLSRDMMTSVFGMEKPVVFPYDEVVMATGHFKETNILGQGAFGSVYYGLLRNQEVAIKRMKAIKTEEFLAEIKVLCKAHHTNLIELLGYASNEDELFLVYEYAEHRSLSDCLHDPLSKGFTPLTWNLRVQIALDTARGLEYIHEHTRTHHVHRDIKTSNILLDGSFQAKVADFGLAKLIEKTSDGEASVTRIVGTFGYLAPEYLRDGQATAKSDVYAFGVVLFELITGQEAISRSKAGIPSTPERRTLISIMLRALHDSPSPLKMSSLLELIDPTLMNVHPHDCLFQIAKLAQQCVEDDPALRPDMKYVVFSLSQILLSSIEWEATLAGNSQVFSGLTQGR